MLPNSPSFSFVFLVDSSWNRSRKSNFCRFSHPFLKHKDRICFYVIGVDSFSVGRKLWGVWAMNDLTFRAFLCGIGILHWGGKNS